MRVSIALLTLAAAAALLPPPAAAQMREQAAITAQRTAMDRLAWMRGTWRGPATSRGPGGEVQLTQTERVGTMLDGSVTVVEGRGFAADGSTGFNAFAVISFDPADGRYTMRSYTGGRSGDFTLDVAGDGWRWEVPAGPAAVVRYVATYRDGVWRETGDYVAAGQPARRIFEMALTRVADTDWPEGGAMTRE